jgi:16S rRNA processing protein RimM
MSYDEGDSAESLIVVARAVRTRGLKGEIVAELLTDFPERFENIQELIALSPSGTRHVVKLAGYWFQQNRVVLKIVGYERLDVAKALIGYEFAVPESDRVPLPEDHFYDWELEGCVVETTSGSRIGKVREIIRTGGVDVLAVAGDSGSDYLIPMAASIVIGIDTSSKSIVIDPPQGLLEL